MMVESVFDLMSKTMLQVCWSFILWFMLHLEGCWSSRSSYFIGIASESKPQNCYGIEDLFGGWPFISHEGTTLPIYDQSHSFSLQ